MCPNLRSIGPQTKIWEGVIPRNLLCIAVHRLNRLFALYDRRECQSYFFRGGISNSGNSQQNSEFPVVGDSYLLFWIFQEFPFPWFFPFPIRKCRIWRTAKWGSTGVRKSSLFQFFWGKYGSPRINWISQYPSSSASTKVYSRGSLIKKFYPKTVAVIWPGVRVTVREKNPDFQFSGTSRCGKVFPMILGDPAIPWHTKFLSRKNFFMFQNFEVSRKSRFGYSSYAVSIFEAC